MRELIILRKLAEDEANIYTTRIYDILFPEGVEKCSSKPAAKPSYDLNKLKHLFLVMELGQTDLYKLIKSEN